MQAVFLVLFEFGRHWYFLFFVQLMRFFVLLIFKLKRILAVGKKLGFWHKHVNITGNPTGNSQA